MKKIITLSLLGSLLVTASAATFYKSAKSGKFVTKSYSTSHKSTTYKSSF